MKKVKLLNLSSKEKENALNEVRILASIRQPNVICYKECFLEDKHSPVALPGRREGVMVDTGAHDNIAGRQWVDRQIDTTREAGVKDQVASRQLPIPVNISGIGSMRILKSFCRNIA